MRRFAALAYGLICYAVFFATFLYLVAFLGNLVVPRTIDSGAPGGVAVSFAVNAALLILFGVQHSLMARPRFKAWWMRTIPRPVERSTYVLASSACLIALFALWQPMPQVVWHTEGVPAALLQAGFFAGVGLVLLSTFLIDHFDLFGLRQVVLYFRGRPYQEKRFTTPLFYKWIRHPLYVGWIVTFFMTPTMSAGHLFFAVVMTGYILVAIPMEERDLAAALGDTYRRWRARTPMFVPRFGERAVEPGAPATELR